MIDRMLDSRNPGAESPAGPREEMERTGSGADALSLIRHELRTPVNAILGYSEMLLEDAEDQGSERFIPDLRRIHTAGQRLLTVIGELLAAKSEGGLVPAREALTTDTTAAHGEPLAETVQRGPVESGSVLVVDDNENNRDLLSRRLQRQGHGVALAVDGQQALEMLRKGSYDLVLLDLVMPVMDGYQTLEQMRNDPALCDIPVIMLSALDELDKVVRCLEMGAVDYLSKPFNPLLLRARIDACLEKKRLRDREISYVQQITRERDRSDALLNAVIPLGVALSAERDFDRLLERILIEAKSFCNADSGSLYLRTEDDHLKFVTLRNDSLNITMGGSTGIEIPFPPLALYDAVTNLPNHRYVVTHAALTGNTINIPDAYATESFDFSGTWRFDRETGYRSTSFLTVPLKNGLNQVVGVLQLINALDHDTGAVVPFDPAMQPVVESLSSLATIALEAYVREQGLRLQIAELRIEIDQARKERQVSEITETDYFQQLQEKARNLRARK